MFNLRIVAVLFYSLIQPGLNSRCPKWPEAKQGFYNMGMCHNLVDTAMSWGQARDFCAKFGWRLAWADDAFLRDLPKIKSGYICLWVGATDQVTEGDWRWLDDAILPPVTLPPPAGPTKKTTVFVNLFPGMHYRITAKPDVVTRPPLLTLCCRECLEKLSNCALVNFNKRMSKCLGYSSENVLESKEKTTEAWQINAIRIV